MDMSGERRIPASRDRVWAALNDPAVLRASIPGCKTLQITEPDVFQATASVKIGPIAANFTGIVKLLDLDPPASYRIEGSGQGGPAGFARGGATVTLAEEAEATLLTYKVRAEIGGKLAQLGARLIDASAKQMADQFFNNFVREVAATAQHAQDTSEIAAYENAVPMPHRPAMLIFGFPPHAWVAGAVFLFILVMLFKGYL